MELRHLLYFKTVAEELHFRKAAALLFISQPPLSRQIRELEEELGVTLFLRNNKRVSLTAAGLYFKAEVDAIFAKLEESRHTVRKIHEGENGELRIGFISSVHQPHFAGILKALREAFPYVKTSLFEAPSVKQLEAIKQGRLDAGIVRAPVHAENLKLHTLFFDPFMVVLPKQQEQPADDQAIAACIKDQPFIFFNKEYAPDYHQKLIEICGRMGFSPHIMHEANNVHSIFQLVEAGLGVSILPLSLQLQYAYMQVMLYPLSHIPVQTEVVLVCKKSNQNPALKWFIDHYPT